VIRVRAVGRVSPVVAERGGAESGAESLFRTLSEPEARVAYRQALRGAWLSGASPPVAAGAMGHPPPVRFAYIHCAPSRNSHPYRRPSAISPEMSSGAFGLGAGASSGLIRARRRVLVAVTTRVP